MTTPLVTSSPSQSWAPMNRSGTSPVWLPWTTLARMSPKSIWTTSQVMPLASANLSHSALMGAVRTSSAQMVKVPEPAAGAELAGASDAEVPVSLPLLQAASRRARLAAAAPTLVVRRMDAPFLGEWNTGPYGTPLRGIMPPRAHRRDAWGRVVVSLPNRCECSLNPEARGTQRRERLLSRHRWPTGSRAPRPSWSSSGSRPTSRRPPPGSGRARPGPSRPGWAWAPRSRRSRRSP